MPAKESDTIHDTEIVLDADLSGHLNTHEDEGGWSDGVGGGEVGKGGVGEGGVRGGGGIGGTRHRIASES